MYAQCPNCQTVFDVADEDLAAADGMVCCGVCEHVFKATDQVIDNLPDASATAEAEAAPAVAEAAADATEEFDPDAAAAAPAEDFARSLAEAELRASQEPAKRRSVVGTLFWSLATLVLFAGLGLQAVYALRGDLADNPTFAPVVEALCDVVHCSMPVRRDLDKVVLQDRDVRSDPGHPGTLLITAKLVNQAQYPQPFPLLRLTLSDYNGTVLAARDFKPAEYLADARGATEMPSDQPFVLRLEVADPGKNASAFQFQLY